MTEYWHSTGSCPRKRPPKKAVYARPTRGHPPAPGLSRRVRPRRAAGLGAVPSGQRPADAARPAGGEPGPFRPETRGALRVPDWHHEFERVPDEVIGLPAGRNPHRGGHALAGQRPVHRGTGRPSSTGCCSPNGNILPPPWPRPGLGPAGICATPRPGTLRNGSSAAKTIPAGPTSCGCPDLCPAPSTTRPRPRSGASCASWPASRQARLAEGRQPGSCPAARSGRTRQRPA
jgi:hypothetical protein